MSRASSANPVPKLSAVLGDDGDIATSSAGADDRRRAPSAASSSWVATWSARAAGTASRPAASPSLARPVRSLHFSAPSSTWHLPRGGRSGAPEVRYCHWGPERGPSAGPVGTRSIAAEPSQARPTFELRSGDAGAGLYVSASGSFESPASAAWEPSDEQRAALARTAGAVEQLLDDVPAWAIDLPAALPLDQRTIYFQVPREPWKGSRADVDRYAVIGGKALAIARLTSNGRWVLSHLDRRFSDTGLLRAYQPLVAFDFDGDGVPEIVFQWNAGDGWSDSILGLDGNGRLWQEHAESVGGSTA